MISLVGPDMPEVLVVGVECLSVNHGIDRVDAFEISIQKDVCLDLLGEDRNNLW